MKRTSGVIGLIAIVALTAIAVGFFPSANSQMQLSPSYLPIGVASSGNSSMAWFHHPASGRVLVCQPTSAQGSGLTGIQCIDSKVP